MSKNRKPKPGDLRVWWIPQIPGEPFFVPVQGIHEARKLLDTLARYDLFQLEHRIKPDYSNAGGLEVYREELAGTDLEPELGEDEDGWTDWTDGNGDDIDHSVLIHRETP